MRLTKGKLLNEIRNYHYSNNGDVDLDVTNIKPEYSDNLFRMKGRDTGHFGSGVYFSTYDNSGREEINVANDKFSGSEGLRRVSSNLVTIDLDEVPNMFRVRTDSLAETLYETLSEINNFFYRNALGEEYNFRNSDLINTYRLVRTNFRKMGVSFMSLKEFMVIVSETANDFRLGSENAKRIGSLSTRIMTELGYSGVDVSGLFKWDNTRHGSVVYDLGGIKKLIKKPTQNNPNVDVKNTDIFGGNLKHLKVLMRHDGATKEDYRIAINQTSIKDLVSLYADIPKEYRKYAKRVINDFLSDADEYESNEYYKVITKINDDEDLLMDFISNPNIQPSLDDPRQFNRLIKGPYSQVSRSEYLKKIFFSDTISFSDLFKLDLKQLSNLGLIEDVDVDNFIEYSVDEKKRLLNKIKNNLKNI